MTKLARWVTSYFAHGDLSTRDVANLEFHAIDPKRKSEISALREEELQRLVAFDPLLRSDRPLATLPEHLLYHQTFTALFEAKNRESWPIMKIWLFCCDSSVGIAVHGTFEIEKLAKANDRQPIPVLFLDNAHHAVRNLLASHYFY